MSPSTWDGCSWLNPPAQWSVDADGLHVRSSEGTDFWRHTHYGFVKDDGHVFGREVAGDVKVTATFTGTFASQYDQAGLMLRASETEWLKCGIEYVDGMRRMSTVVTRDFSDWSIVSPPELPERLTVELTRSGDCVEVRYVLDGPELVRVAYLEPGRPLLCGVMCASPQGPGFESLFERFDIVVIDQP
jgi:regulation of enolase protein 1 (concanavalin A-like superfamily)